MLNKVSYYILIKIVDYIKVATTEKYLSVL